MDTIPSMIKDRAVHCPANMTPEKLERGIRWLMRRYYSPGNRTKLTVAAMNNRALFHQWPPVRRLLAMAALTTCEVYLWQSRATPSLRWLVDRLVPYNPLRLGGDLFRGTNFWRAGQGSVAPDVELTTASPFAEAQGCMAPGGRQPRPC